MPIAALYQDPFKPVLFNSTPVELSIEHRNYIKLILDKACSDSRFADKAYLAIIGVLESASVPVPEVTSLSPSSLPAGDPATDLTVSGTGFGEGSKIYVDGVEQITTVNSDTSLTTNITPALEAGVVPVHVVSGDGVVSNPSDLTYTGIEVLEAKKEPKVEYKKEDRNQGVQTTQDPSMPDSKGQGPNKF